MSPAPRRRTRRWTRRGAWTAAIALNLVLASAVAAAIGGARIVPASVVAATHRVIERIRPHVPQLYAQPRRVAAARHHAAAPLRIARPSVAPRPVPAGIHPVRHMGPRPLPRIARPRPERVRPFVATRHRALGHRAARHWRDRPVASPPGLKRLAQAPHALPRRWQQPGAMPPRGWRRADWHDGRPARWRQRAWRGGGPRFGRGPRRR